MWPQIICGLIIYRVVKRVLFDDDNSDVETSDSNALFSVAHRLEKLYGGRVYIGLRIPDADTCSRQSIDMVLVTKEQLIVISVKNISGILSVSSDGCWVLEGDGKHKPERLPDPAEETSRQASILESYLEQRGISLPKGYVSYKVILPNPNFRAIHQILPPEVITYDQWVQLKTDTRSVFTSWVKDAFCIGKKEMQESIYKQINFVLSTAPMWDRLELKGDKFILGEFHEFKGKQEDIQALRNIKRSKVARVTVQKTRICGLVASSTLQVLYSPRDYRNEGFSADWREVTVRAKTQIMFQPENAAKPRKFTLSSIVSMSLSA